MARGRGQAEGGRRRRGRGRIHGGPGATANAQASVEFDPGIRETRGQIKGSRKREGDLGSWYKQLVADYGQAQRAGGAALGSIEGAVSKQLAEANSQSLADQARLADSDAAFAALTGGPRDTAGLSKIADAGAAASRSRVAIALPAQQEQANFVARLGGDKAAARLQGIEARTEERNRRGKLKSDLTAQQREKGMARISAKDKILEAKAAQAAEARKLALEEQEARAAERQAASDEALARVESARDNRQRKIDNRQEQERISISRRNANTSERSQRASARGKGGLTPAERRDRREHSSDAMSAAKALLGIKVPKSEKQWAQFEAALIEKLGTSYSAEAAKAVASLRALQRQKAETRSRRMHEGKIPGV